MPTVNLVANPTSILNGESSTLTWTSQNATSCTSNDFVTNSATSNTVGTSTGSLTLTKTYRIDCIGPGGPNYDTETVVVSDPGYTPSPTVSLTVVDDSIPRGSSTLLKWTSTNATTCTSSTFATGNATQNTVGVTTGVLNNQKTFTITCTNAVDSATDDVTVYVEDTTISSSCRAETISGTPLTEASKGTLVYWTIVNPPSGIESYSWSGTDITTPYTTPSFSKAYSTTGVKTVTLTLTLTNGTTKAVTCQTLVVKDGPTFIEI